MDHGTAATGAARAAEGGDDGNVLRLVGGRASTETALAAVPQEQGPSMYELGQTAV